MASQWCRTPWRPARHMVPLFHPVMNPLSRQEACLSGGAKKLRVLSIFLSRSYPATRYGARSRGDGRSELRENARVFLASAAPDRSRHGPCVETTRCSVRPARATAFGPVGSQNKRPRSEEHTSELQSRGQLVFRL